MKYRLLTVLLITGILCSAQKYNLKNLYPKDQNTTVFNKSIIKKPISLFSDFMVWFTGGKSIFKNTEEEKLSPVEFKIPQSFEKNFEFIEKGDIDSFEYYRIANTKNPKKVIMFLHGGGYKVDISIFHWNFVKKALKKNKANDLEFMVFDYPLSYEKGADKMLSYTVEAYKKILENYSADQVLVMGDSAGGGLSAGLIPALLENNLPLPKKLILLSPWVDVDTFDKTKYPNIERFSKADKMLTKDFVENAKKDFLDELDATTPKFSPIYANPEIFPESHIFVGSNETLFPQGVKFYKHLKRTGKNHKLYIGHRGQHVFSLIPTSELAAPSRKVLYQIINEF